MPFGPTSIQSVRSPNQRELVAQWQRASTGRLFPQITEFTPPERETKQLILWDVEADGTTRRFRMRRQGERLTETVAANLTGKTMDEVVPEPLRTPALAAANECLESRCAVYEIITTIDASAHVIECERLLLPFGRDGKVECLIAALQLISYQGTVDRTTVANEFGAHPELGFVGLIPASARDGTAVVLPPRDQAQRAEPAAARVEAPASVARDAGVEKRRTRRRAVHKTGRISARGLSETCTVRDISATGAALDVVNAAKVPNHFTLVMEMESAARSCTVVWRKERQLGVEFR
jgi:PilZ domain/PAS domain